MSQIQKLSKAKIAQLLRSAQEFIEKKNFLQATNILQEVFSSEVDNAEALRLMGLVAMGISNIPKALEFFGASLMKDSKQKELKNSFQRIKTQYDENLFLIRQCNEDFNRDMVSVENLIRLGYSYLTLKSYNEAITIFQKAYELEGNDSRILFGLGKSLILKERKEEGIKFFEQIYSQGQYSKFDYSDQSYILNNLGSYYEFDKKCLLTALGFYEKDLEISYEHCKNLTDFSFESTQSYLRVAQINFQTGRVSKAINYLKELIKEKKISAIFFQALIFYIHYDETISPEEHLYWAKECYKFCFPEVDTEKIMSKSFHHLDLDPEKKKLRVGFVSGDFKQHAVAQYIVGLFENFNQETFEIFCFYNNEEDLLTSHCLKGVRNYWKIVNMSDEAVYDLIQQEKIDVLIDLSGFSFGARTELFIQRPCPVQASWLGQSGPCGIPQINYMIAGNYSFYDDEQKFYNEKVYALPDYLGPFNGQLKTDIKIEVHPPCLKNGYITFGSFNQMMKTTDKVLETWAKILFQVPGSKLFMKTSFLGQKFLQERILKVFETQGIDSSRIMFEDYTNVGSYFESFKQVDLVLDTFPIGGGTTSLNLLSCGIPIVSLDSCKKISNRVSGSLLKNFGLEENLAYSLDEYIEKAVRLANDKERLVNYRQIIREKFINSNVLNYAKFAKDFEQVVKKMWKDHMLINKHIDDKILL